MGFVIFWLICGVGAAMIASNKNRSALVWFFGGVMLGPIGIIIIACLSREPALPLGPDGVSMDEHHSCPYCAETIKAAAIVCKHCGKDVIPVIQAPNSPSLLDSYSA
jgi:hypothetical protein